MKLRWLFVLLATLLAGCKSPPPPPELPQTESDAGFEDAGTGTQDAGTPVSLERCGNALLEEQEACDDGNLFQGDGCSEDCQRETVCEQARSLRAGSVAEPEGWLRYDATLEKDAPAFDAGCGAWPSLALGLVTAAPSRLELRLSGPSSLALTSPAPCGVPGRCLAGGVTEPSDLGSGESLAVLVFGDLLSSADFSLHWRLRPLRTLGQSCDEARVRDVCGTGRRCAAPDAGLASCAPSSPPSIGRVEAFFAGRSGKDLAVLVQVSDPDGDVERLRLRMLDAAGAPVAVSDANADGVLESEVVEVSRHSVVPWRVFLRGFFEQHPVASVEVTALDAAESASSPVTAVFTAAARATLGQACDPRELLPACALGTACKGAPPTCEAGAAPVLSSLVWQVDAAQGSRLVVEGADADRDAHALWLELFDAAGAPSLADVDGDGVAESSLQVAMTPTAGSTALSALLDLTLLPAQVDHLAGRLVDRTGLASGRLEASRTVLQRGAPGAFCDSQGLLSPCASGLACLAGVCGTGTPPVIDEAGWLRVGTGGRLRLSGHDAQGDASALRLSLQDGAGLPQQVIDTDGDLVGDSAQLSVSLDGRSLPDGGFQLEVDLDRFAPFAERLGVEVLDRAGLSGSTSLSLVDPEVRTVGQSCSLARVNLCEPGGVCWPAPTGPVCEGLSSRRRTSCLSAPRLTPGVAATSSLGPSLWDCPLGCSEGNPTGLWEALFRLELSAPASQVRLTTDLAGTSVDTVLFVLPACAETGAGHVLSCADDLALEGGKLTSEVTLLSVAAGSYLVVVESWSGNGEGTVALKAEVTP